MDARGGELVEYGVGIDHTRAQTWPAGGCQRGLRGQILQQDVEGGRSAGALICPSQSNGYQIVS